MELDKVKLISQRLDLEGAEFVYDKPTGKLYFRQSNEERVRPIGSILKEDGMVAYYKMEKEKDKYIKYMAWSIYVPLVEAVDFIVYETETFLYRITSEKVRKLGFITSDKGHGNSKKYIVPIKYWDVKSKEKKYQSMLSRLGYEWFNVLKQDLVSPEVRELMKFLKKQRDTGSIFPASEKLFKPFQLTGYVDTKVVLFHDYPFELGRANGLAWSVEDNVVGEHPKAINLFDIVEEEMYDGFNLNRSKDLRYLARQGVLLLNSVYTANIYSTKAHEGKGWEDWNRKVISSIITNKLHAPVVFILLGDKVQGDYGELLENPGNHLVLKAPMPEGEGINELIKAKIFTKCNNYLKKAKRRPINW